MLLFSAVCPNFLGRDISPPVFVSTMCQEETFLGAGGSLARGVTSWFMVALVTRGPVESKEDRQIHCNLITALSSGQFTAGFEFCNEVIPVFRYAVFYFLRYIL